MNENENKTSSGAPSFAEMWAIYAQDDKTLKRWFWIAVVILLLVVLVSVLPFVFHSVARLIRSYKDLQCAVNE